MKYDYKLVRSSRRTISVTISADNSIIVRAPNKTSLEKIEKFLQSKEAWLDKKIEANSKIIAANSSVKSLETILVAGEEWLFKVGQTNGVRGGVIYVKSLSHLQKVLCENFGEEFLSRFNSAALSNGFKARSVKLRSYKARWGCCDCSGNIEFNYKILMLAKELQNYVIIHELCHLKFMNHSKEFWAEVKRYCPDYLTLRKRLKDYAFITRLYP